VHFSLPFVPCSSTFFLVNFFLHSIAINFSSHHTHATYAMYTELGILQYIVHMVGRISKNFNPGWNLLFVCIRPATSSFLRKDSSFYFLASQTSLWSVTTVQLTWSTALRQLWASIFVQHLFLWSLLSLFHNITIVWLQYMALAWLPVASRILQVPHLARTYDKVIPPFVKTWILLTTNWFT
jgi:hypothetical protein